jgi:hypothetical protein
MQRSLFVDVDGVFNDFDRHCEELFGNHPSKIPDQELWRLVNEDAERFWTEGPLMEGAVELWEVVREYNPTFLTGCPKSGFDEAAVHKRVWLRRHFGDTPVITCLSKEKQLHMKAPGDVLLDDMPRNLKRWEAARGVAIRYRRGQWREAIDAVRQAMTA